VGFLEKGKLILDNTSTLDPGQTRTAREGEMVLDRTEIEAILPHRDPFLMIDRVTELEPGKRAVAEKDILATNDVFRGHFPDRPVFPGVLQLEALAQTGAVAVLSQPENHGKIILFARADDVRFKRPVVPGDTLRLEMELTTSRGPIGKGEGKAYVGPALVCSGVLTFAVAES
jgi:3-hydroxyacyl-[acyl-carrier-protein] dehydratase